MTLAEILAQAAARLPPASPRADAEILLAHVLGCTRAQLFARLRDTLPPADAEHYGAAITRRERGEPVAYITGEKGFWTLMLKVTPAVLVPRPETELLVEWALLLASPAEGALHIADIGTGSGCIALALASERPDAQVLATDFSEEALRCARENAQTLNLRNVEFLHGHFLEPLDSPRVRGQDRFRGNDGGFEIIVSNPPYIAAQDPHLDALRHEPLMALTDGGDGLSCLREIIHGAPAALKRGGWLLVEHGYDQGAVVRELFEQAGFTRIETRRDLGGNERATGGEKGLVIPSVSEESGAGQIPHCVRNDKKSL